MSRRVDDLDADVLVVGAGPTGLTLACELARRGISCCVLERRSSPTPTSRALGIQKRTLEIFGAMEVIPPAGQAPTALAFEQNRSKPPSAVVWLRDKVVLRWPAGSGRDTRLTKSPYATRWIPQAEVEEALQSRLEALGRLDDLGESLKLASEVIDIRDDGDKVVAITGQREFSAKWLVACDGGRSVVRKRLGIPFTGTTHDFDLLVADVELEWSGSGPASAWAQPGPIYIWLHPDGPFTALKVAHRAEWRVMAFVRADPNAPTMTTTWELMQRLLTERTGDTSARITSAPWLSSWKLSERMIQAYKKGRMFLAGDAAHIHSPLGGQGLNTGVQDAYNLAWKLAAVVRGHSSEHLLETYEAERLPIAKNVLRGTRALAQLTVAATPARRILRNLLVPQVVRVAYVRAWFISQLSQVGVNYRRSSLSVSSGRFSRLAPHAGDRAPDAPATKPDMLQHTSVFLEISEPRWHLLLFQGAQGDAADLIALNEIASRVEVRFGGEIRPHFILRRKQATDVVGAVPSVLMDEAGDVHSTYAVVGCCIYLVRPDGYIGFRGQLADAQAMFDYLGRVFDLIGAD